MAGVGFRSEQQFDKDSNERAKRDRGNDLGDMEVDGGKDRQAKDKPIETTPQIAKKPKQDEAAERGSDPHPPNIHISTPKGRQEASSSSSKTQPTQRPRRGRSEEARGSGRKSPPISASVAAEATEAARNATPNDGWYTKQQKQLANQGQTVVTMDMLQKYLQVLQDSQGKIEKKLDENIKQTRMNSESVVTNETSGLHDDRKKSCRR